jgi:hypothetical protein
VARSEVQHENGHDRCDAKPGKLAPKATTSPEAGCGEPAGGTVVIHLELSHGRLPLGSVATT